MSRKTVVQSVSFQLDVWRFLEGKEVSKIINEAIREYRKSRLMPETKILLLKQEKRELMKKLAVIDEEIDTIIKVEIEPHRRIIDDDEDATNRA